MDGEQLFDLVFGGQASTAEIAKLDLETATGQIRELREQKPDDLALSDQEIAERILRYARAHEPYAEAKQRGHGRGWAIASLVLGCIVLAGCGIALVVIVEGVSFFVEPLWFCFGHFSPSLRRSYWARVSCAQWPRS